MVLKKCQQGSCITKPCRRDSQTGLYEAKCTFLPKKSQTARESIMFMQSFDSVSTSFFYSHKGTLWGKKMIWEIGFSAMKIYILVETWEIIQTIN